MNDIKRLTRWRVSTFWVMLIGYIGYYLCRANLPAAFGMLEQTFGYTNAQLGLIAFYSEAAYSLGKFITGPLADKLGGKKFFLLGMLGAIVFNVAFALGASLSYFIIIWCFARFFLSMGWGGLIKVIGSWYEHERHGTIMGIISINFQFGGVAATYFSAFLISKGVNWQGLFFYPAGVLFLIFIWSALASRESPQDVVPGTTFGKSTYEKKLVIDGNYDHGGLGTVIFLLRLPMFQKLLFFSFLSHILRSVFLFWTPKLLLDLGMKNENAVFNSALFPLLGAVGTILLGWYTDRYVHNGDRARPMCYLLIGLILCQLDLAYLASLPNPPLITIAVIIGLSGFFLFGPYSMSAGALSLDIAGAKRAGSATGLIDGTGYIGGAIAAWGAGKISDTVGWSQVFLILAITGAISTVAAFLLSLELRAHYKKIQS